MITGATGFIGLELCQRLLEENADIRVLLRDLEHKSLLPAALQVEPVLGDLRNLQSLVEACSDVDTICHLAGVAHVSNSANKGELADTTNVLGCKNLLEAALKQNVRRIVFLSSSLASAAELGAGDVTDYGKGKREAELLLLEAAKKGQIEVLILRPVNVFGVGMKGNIASMISMIHRGLLPRLPDLSSKISLIAVQDLVEAILLAAESDQTAKIYSVTDGQEYPIAAIEEAIYQCLGKRLPMWKTPAVILYAAAVLAGIAAKLMGRETSIGSRTYRNLTSDNLFDNAEICAELGFQPSQNLYQSLPNIVGDIVSKKSSSNRK